VAAGAYLSLCGTWRPPEDVVGYQAGRVEPEDQGRQEAHAGPVRPRHPARADWIKGDPAVVGHAGFARPMVWESIACSRCLDATGEGRISPAEPGSRVAVSIKLRPKGGWLLTLLLPLMRRMVHEREDQNLERIKAILEDAR
jgi:hypothetical protein